VSFDHIDDHLLDVGNPEVRGMEDNDHGGSRQLERTVGSRARFDRKVEHLLPGEAEEHGGHRTHHGEDTDRLAHSMDASLAFGDRISHHRQVVVDLPVCSRLLVGTRLFLEGIRLFSVGSRLFVLADHHVLRVRHHVVEAGLRHVVEAGSRHVVEAGSRHVEEANLLLF